MKRISILLLAVVMLFTCVMPVAFAGDIDTSKKVKKLEVEKAPDKVYYEVGDVFTVEGGIVRVIYDDGTEQLVPMTSEDFTVATPSMSAVGTKNINVKYNEFTASCAIG